jgi:tetratricopeptide (TPR) repeat protein
VALDHLGKYQEAITWFDKVLAINKNDTRVMYNKGSALDSLGKYQEAITWYDKDLAINKNDIHAMYNKGLALDNLDKYQEAITWFDKVLAINKNYTDAMNDKGVALDSLGKHQEAITWFDKMLAINGNDTRAMNNKGVALDSLGKHRDAITWYDRAIKQTQTQSTGVDIDIVSNKAYDLGVRLKEYDSALSITDQYLKKNPEHKGLLCTTAEIYNETGYEEIALHYKDQLTKLDPNYKCGLIAKVSEIEKESFA